MNDSREGAAAFLLRKLLRVLSWGYLAATSVRDFLYRKGVFRTFSVSIPVISVGNLTVGGTGKTPFTIYLADLINQMNREVAVVTRGYGSDEHIVLKEELPSARIIVEADRYKAALLAERENREVVVLDDGYQHRRIARDLNILLVDAGEPFEKAHILPRGLLREPLDAVKRADMVVITKSDKLSPAGLEALVRAIRIWHGRACVLTARHRPVRLIDPDGRASQLDVLSGKNVALVSGIADPWYFEFAVKRSGASVLWHQLHTDHHRYTVQGVRRLFRKAAMTGAERLLTTSKDMVKLRGILPADREVEISSLEVEMEIVKGKEALIAGLHSIGIS